MMTLLEGLLLGFAYVMPIGAQNLFVIHSSMTNDTAESFKVSSFVIIMDISLALACYFGIGFFVNKFPIFALILQVFGGLYLLKIAVSLFKASATIDTSLSKRDNFASLRSAFVLTWMNPQALVDGSILLGSFNSKTQTSSHLFILGVCLASMTWFYSLTAMMRIFHTKLNSKRLKTINIICGIVLFYLGGTLLFNALTKVGGV
ncbi:MAG: LysE/ArgO family amino acid transporter [Bacteriovoracaceae bacterium]